MLRGRALFASLTVALLALPGFVAGDAGPDAGTGQDAGSSAESAIRLAGTGSYVGAAGERDEDWYRLDVQSSTPQCVEHRISSSMNGRSTLSVVSSDRTRTVKAPLRDGDIIVGLAAPSASHSFSQVRRTGSASDVVTYDMAVRTMGFADPDSGDAGSLTDTGSVTSAALDAPRGCFAGFIGDTFLSDAVDLFRVPLRVDETVYYSLAGAGTLTLIDAAGQVVGPEIVAGGVAGATANATGDHFLRISTSSTSTSPYAVGLLVGPPDPGSGCRPMCLL